jgi:hypothetical protein
MAEKGDALMTEETETPKPRRSRAKAAGAGEAGTAKPRGRPRKAAPIEDRVEKLADEAVEAGKKLLETDTGKSVAGAAEKAFETAEDAGRKFLESDTGKAVADAAEKALDTAEELTRDVRAKAAEVAKKAVGPETSEEVSRTAKAVWQTPVGRNVAIGAGAGAALGMFILNPVLGAVIGGGLGYLRTITRKG